jgi:hypothetical protein
VFYPPVILYVVRLAIEHRSLTLFTAANPGIAGGGFIGESKFEILRALARGGDEVARAALLPADLPVDRRIAAARRFIDDLGLQLPVVLKPDRGQRGAGVVIIRSFEALADHVARTPADLIVQEYVAGQEFGVFYYRYPSRGRGAIFSVTEKRFPSVVGDGRRPLEELILADDRAVCLHHVHRAVHRKRLDEVPAAGERVQLVEIGSHCRGSLFLDAGHLVTPALERAFDAMAGRFEGFCFGRFDVRAPSIDDFTAGRNLKVVELNGVTSEATSIYDPAHGLGTAYRVLFAQWRLAFEIGSENRRRGVEPTPLAELLALVRSYRRAARLRPVATHRPVTAASFGSDR